MFDLLLATLSRSTEFLHSGLHMDKQLSFFSIPAVWVTAFVPVILKSYTIVKVKGFNNVQPRGNVARVKEDKSIPVDVAARIERMEGAHMNGNEAFPLWAAAVLAANYAGLPNHTVNSIAIAYFFARVFYNIIYITSSTRAMGSLRSLTWFSSLALPMYLLFASASTVMSR
ncbi:hypothetical protein MKEN_00973400 [Mycena kentingensis (nom. inval.)]|nr:hypothetical protein MKEN_00973400 [Mycena kentingensis (nom. inval.)]